MTLELTVGPLINFSYFDVMLNTLNYNHHVNKVLGHGSHKVLEIKSFKSVREYINHLFFLTMVGLLVRPSHSIFEHIHEQIYCLPSP